MTEPREPVREEEEFFVNLVLSLCVAQWGINNDRMQPLQHRITWFYSCQQLVVGEGQLFPYMFLSWQLELKEKDRDMAESNFRGTPCQGSSEIETMRVYIKGIPSPKFVSSSDSYDLLPKCRASIPRTITERPMKSARLRYARSACTPSFYKESVALLLGKQKLENKK